MNRRTFLTTLVGGVAVAAAVRTFPFRVFSFPSEIKRDYYSIPWPINAYKELGIESDVIFTPAAWEWAGKVVDFGFPGHRVHWPSGDLYFKQE